MMKLIRIVILSFFLILIGASPIDKLGITLITVNGMEIIPNQPFLDPRPLQPPIVVEITNASGGKVRLVFNHIITQGIDIDLSELVAEPCHIIWISTAPPVGDFELCASGPGISCRLGCEQWDFDRDGDVDQTDFSERQRFLVGQGGGCP